MIDDAGAEGVNFGCTDGNKLIGYGEVHHTHGDNWSEFQSVSTPNKTEYLNENCLNLNLTASLKYIME